MRVLKFGGTSIGDSRSIRRVVEIVRGRATGPLLLVFSALGDTTDHLLRLGTAAAEGRSDACRRILDHLVRTHGEIVDAFFPLGRDGELRARCDVLFGEITAVSQGIAVLRDFSPPVQDRLLGSGELLSTGILCGVLGAAGLPVTWVDARDLVVTDGRHTGAEPLLEETSTRCRRVLRPLLERGAIPLTQGFLGRSVSGVPTTLGRGGSDYTASLLGAALDAREIEIWTDVDGIMTADPSLVPAARSIPAMSFGEAAELALFGARVLHPKTLAPAVGRGIPVRVLNTHRPGGNGTLILGRAGGNGHPVKSIAYKEGMTVVNLVSARMFQFQGFLRRVFETFDRHRLTPDLVSTSLVSVAVALGPDSGLDAAVEDLRELGEVSIHTGQALVSVVGDRLKETPGIVGQVFEDLRDVKISMVSQGGSEINLSFAVAEVALPKVVSRLHRRFFEGTIPPGLSPAQADGEVHLYV